MAAVAETGLIPVWESSVVTRVLVGATVLVLVAAFFPGLATMVQTWSDVEEYSYGFFIPVIVAFLIWQRRDRLRQNEPKASWWGVACIALALLLCAAGRMSEVRILMQYGFVLALFGVSLASLGRAGTRIIRIPLLMLALMVPLPHFVMSGISEQLQLLSSWLGVALIQACNISVYLEGNVIDLGSYKLQVADACSGLRYLFPLMALGLVAAYFFRAPLWKRVLVVLSTLPLTVIINSIRIGLIGVSVEYWGPSMAEGLLHEIEGWFMFLVCLAVLFGEMALLSRIGAPRTSLSTAFGIDWPERRPAGTPVLRGAPSRPLQTILLLVTLLALAMLLVPAATNRAPARETFGRFPMDLPGGWSGRSDSLDADTLSVLQLDDYLLADFSGPNAAKINFYIAYYASQTGSEKASHSPRTCIPGGGWRITDMRPSEVAIGAGKTLSVNRVVIERGETRDLVYYWFKQSGRWVSNEWAVKWYIFVDSLTRGRSDGALIRVVAAAPYGTPIAETDAQMQRFLAVALPRLTRFVPD